MMKVSLSLHGATTFATKIPLGVDPHFEMFKMSEFAFSTLGHFIGKPPRYLMKLDDDSFINLAKIILVLNSSPYKNMEQLLVGKVHSNIQPIKV